VRLSAQVNKWVPANPRDNLSRAVTKGREPGIFLATIGLGPGYFDTKQKYWKEKKCIKIQNDELKNKSIVY